jgi:hypothetical protein
MKDAEEEEEEEEDESCDVIWYNGLGTRNNKKIISVFLYEDEKTEIKEMK